MRSIGLLFGSLVKPLCSPCKRCVRRDLLRNSTFMFLQYLLEEFFRHDGHDVYTPDQVRGRR